MNNRTIIVFDFETGNINNEICEIVQVAAVAINPATLDPFEAGEFNSLMCPLDWSVFDEGTVAIHKKSVAELKKAPHPEEVWGRFASWVRQFTLTAQANQYTLPVAAGHNMIDYDMPIVERYCKKYGPNRKRDDGRVEQALFSPFHKYDTMHIAQFWLEDRPELGKFGLDKLRRFFDMPKESIDNAHDALQDCRDAAAILKKFLGLSRRFSPNIVWEGCFNPEKVAVELERRRLNREKEQGGRRR